MCSAVDPGHNQAVEEGSTVPQLGLAPPRSKTRAVWNWGGGWDAADNKRLHVVYVSLLIVLRAWARFLL